MTALPVGIDTRETVGVDRVPGPSYGREHIGSDGGTRRNVAHGDDDHARGDDLRHAAIDGIKIRERQPTGAERQDSGNDEGDGTTVQAGIGSRCTNHNGNRSPLKHRESVVRLAPAAIAKP